MNPVQLFKAWRLWTKVEAVAKENAPVKSKVPQLTHLIISLAGIVGVPELAHKWLSSPAHLTVYVVLVAASALLHALSPSIFGGPSDSAQQAAGIATKAGMIVLALLLLGGTARAQEATSARTALPNNIYAFGLTYNPNASPVVAGTGLYGRMVDAKGTYAVAVIDVVPTTARPYTVTTNPSAGVAQKFYSHDNLKVFATPAAGLSYTGSNTGYSYALGGMVTYDLSPSYALGFGGRLFKSSISNSGYQPALSFEFILKQ